MPEHLKGTHKDNMQTPQRKALALNWTHTSSCCEATVPTLHHCAAHIHNNKSKTFYSFCHLLAGCRPHIHHLITIAQTFGWKDLYQCKVVVLESTEMFGFHFCTVKGNGGFISIFHCRKRQVKPTQNGIIETGISHYYFQASGFI